jgi:peroxiredoxin
MDTLFLLVRLVLAGVLAVAGITKLADLAGSRQAMRDFGLPVSLAAPFGLLLPLVEVVIALALLPAATAWVSATGALLLLLLFIGGIALNLARGRTPNCHCFGQLHSQPIGRATLIRNGLLALLAGLIVVQGPNGAGPGLIGWLAGLSATSYFVLIGGAIVLALVAGQSWVVFNLLRQNGRLLLRLEAIEKHLGLIDPTSEEAQAAALAAAPKGLAVGTPAPSFELPALDGTQQSLGTLLAPAKSVLLIFSSPTCGPCVDLMPEVAQWQRTHASQLTIAVVNRGTAEAVRAKAGEISPAHLLLQREGEVASAYAVSGTPSAVLVGTDGNIRSPLAAGPSAIRELVTNATQPLGMLAERLLRRAPIHLDAGQGNGQPVPNPRPAFSAIGTAAPAFELPDLDGKMVGLAQLRGTPTLLLFWNPTCGYCRRMLGDLQAWEAQAHPNALRLLLISTGSVEANRGLGLAAPVLLESGFSTGFAYGAKGTPSALLIDSQGKVASEVVVGAAAIMPMLNSAPAIVHPLVAQPLAA